MAYPAAPAYTGSKSQTSQGAILWIQTVASPVTWVAIGETLGTKFSDKNVFDKSTNMQSSAEEFLALLPDPGKCEVGLNRVSNDAGQVAVQASYAAGTRMPYSLVFPINTAAGQSTTGDQRNFSAFVEQLSPDLGTNKRITNAFTLQISGPITPIAGS